MKRIREMNHDATHCSDFCADCPMNCYRAELQTEWLKEYCPKCANNDDRGTKYCNCQAEYEVEKDIGIACIHYEEYYEGGDTE